MSIDVFGSIVSDDQVEDAVLGILKLWLPTYLSEVEEQRGLDRGYYQRPVSWEVRSDFEKFPEEQLPMIIVVSTGIGNDAPKKDGSRRYRAPFDIAVVAVVSSLDQIETRRFAYRMGAAVRATMAARQSLDSALDGRVRGVDWVDGRNNELPNLDEGDSRTIWATRQVFSVQVADVLTMAAGPVTPELIPIDAGGDPAPVPPPDTYPPDPIIPDEEHIVPAYARESWRAEPS